MTTCFRKMPKRRLSSGIKRREEAELRYKKKRGG